MRRAYILFSCAVLIACIGGCDGGMLYPLIATDSDTVLPPPTEQDTDTDTDTDTETGEQETDTPSEPLDTGSDSSSQDSDTGTENICVDPFGCYDDTYCENFAIRIGNGCGDGKHCCEIPRSCSGECILLHTEQCANGLITPDNCGDGEACCQPITDEEIPECPIKMDLNFQCGFTNVSSCLSAYGTPTGMQCPETDKVCCYLN